MSHVLSFFCVFYYTRQEEMSTNFLFISSFSSYFHDRPKIDHLKMMKKKYQLVGNLMDEKSSILSVNLDLRLLDIFMKYKEFIVNVIDVANKQQSDNERNSFRHK
jgi:hypothetical protein